ncbi:MAG: HAMP domain-containing protein [Planctomycetes bacterium]|nr:HAMP domain-containing protein [Planctomycetota bacterium]
MQRRDALVPDTATQETTAFARDTASMSESDRQHESGWVRRPRLLRVFLVCGSIVAVLFLVVEAVERIWLSGVSADMLHALHLFRGLAASAMAAILATIVLLRRPHIVPKADTIPSKASTWLRRMQNFSLRIKIVTPMVALSALPAIVTGVISITRFGDALRKDATRRVQFDTRSKAASLQGFLDGVQRDLRFLADMKLVRDLADAHAIGMYERQNALRQDVEREFLVFSQGKRAYYQLRLLGESGMEVVRLNVLDGLPVIVPSDRLQAKQDRYYVRAGLALEPGKIYVSPMDLNVEHGAVEEPARAVLRYACPVFGPTGGRGLLVINVHAEFLLSLVGYLPPEGEAWLVDEHSRYLGYAGSREDGPARFRVDRDRRLSSDHDPGTVKSILECAPEGGTLHTPDRLLSVAPVFPLSSGSGSSWILLVSHARAPLEAPLRHLTVFLSVVLALIVAVAGLTGAMVGRYLAGPVERLRRATREIAASNLSSPTRVDITTGDEVEDLACDFNAMTDQLRQARDKQLAWNKELEQEVARHADRLHELQSGLARADKLASIGQMTAAVMHEVGNPLAAIKTRIQVAEEEGNLCDECKVVLVEVVREVDRLATFLRSFARLSRLRTACTVRLSLADTANGVVAMLAPEIRRRNLTLRFDANPNTPAILGDADQIRQLLFNLILNAADASHPGAEVSVRVEARPFEREGIPPAPGVRIEVADTGAGIAPDVLEKIWTPFFTTKPEGTGLGLAVCRRIVDDHHGTIDVRSHVDAGTVIGVNLRAAAPETARGQGGPDSEANS